VRFNFPVNFVTAPLIADLFLLAILAIGRKEVHDGTLGTNSIQPIDIMVFFLSLAYIAISIDASGLIRFLAFKVLQWGGDVGHRLFFYLYAFFFALASFTGNDPVILSGTAFLAYMTRVSSNIVHPRAWIHTQFAVANIASAILVSSNPTNLVLAGAFDIKFINYTANMIVPVAATAIVLFPFLLYIVFANESLIPVSIKMHELPEGARDKKPVNPNIPNARGNAEEEENRHLNDEQGKLLSLEEIMNPFLDKGGAVFGSIVMAVTLITLLAVNAAKESTLHVSVFWVTLPAAFVMFCWDVGFGWIHRHETQELARLGREEIERARRQRAMEEEEDERHAAQGQEEEENSLREDGLTLARTFSPEDHPHNEGGGLTLVLTPPIDSSAAIPALDVAQLQNNRPSTSATSAQDEKHELTPTDSNQTSPEMQGASPIGDRDVEKRAVDDKERVSSKDVPERATVVSLAEEFYAWAQITFPTPTAVVAHLPFALVPFAFSMFVLVQALVTKGTYLVKYL
jgi:Na+/H+ antiporter NhaD/arsenite permease-like protein